MAATADLFNNKTEQPPSQIKPLEPLYSMLIEMPEQSIRHTLLKMQDFKDESELDERMENISLTKRQYIQQILMAMNAKGMQ